MRYAQQKLGDSKRRQVDRTLQFCNENNLYLDQQLVGSGLSAYSGKHHREGTDLARFTPRVEGRQGAKRCRFDYRKFGPPHPSKNRRGAGIVSQYYPGGVEIVTLIDKQWYTPETLGEIQNLLVRACPKSPLYEGIFVIERLMAV